MFSKGMEIAGFDDSLLPHIEKSIKQVKDTMTLDYDHPAVKKAAREMENFQ